MNRGWQMNEGETNNDDSSGWQVPAHDGAEENLQLSHVSRYLPHLEIIHTQVFLTQLFASKSQTESFVSGGKTLPRRFLTAAMWRRAGICLAVNRRFFSLPNLSGAAPRQTAGHSPKPGEAASLYSCGGHLENSKYVVFR